MNKNVYTTNKTESDVIDFKAAKDIPEFENQSNIFFDKMGYLEPMNIDMSQMKNRLFHYIAAYKDLIEVPSEILNELGDYQVKYTFSIKNGKKEIVDQELYDFYKKRQLEISKYALSQNEQ